MMTNQNKFLSPYFLTLLSFSLLGGFVLYLSAAPWGLGACQDSAIYVSGARHILTGQGFVNYGKLNPITQWPPFFSFTLALVGLSGIEILEAARLLHVLLFGLNILMAGMILKKITGSSAIALLGAGLMLTAKSILAVHVMAWSEPLFIFLAFTGFYLLIEYLGGGSRASLFGAGILIAIACLCRYAGVSLIAAGALMILLYHPKSIRFRIRDCAIFSFLSSLPLGLWLLRNYFLSNNLVNRDFQFHDAPVDYFYELLDTLSSWVLPFQTPASVKYSVLAIIFMAMITVFILAFRKDMKNKADGGMPADPSELLISLMGIFIFINAALELIHLYFMNAGSNANDRHLSVFFAAGLLGSLALVSRLGKLYPDRISMIKKATIPFFVLLAATSLLNSTQILTELHREGINHTSRLWKTSPTIKKVRDLPPDALLYANDPSFIYLLTDRNAMRLPRKYSRRHGADKESAEPTEGFEKRLDKVRENLTDRNGYVVFLDAQLRWFKIPEDELKRHIPLILIDKLPDGSIYQIDLTADAKTVKVKHS